MKHLLIIFSFIFLGACDFIQTKEKKADYCNFTGSNYIPRYIEDKDYERAKKEVPEYESIFELWKVLSTYDGDVSSAAIYNIGLSYLKGNNDVNQDYLTISQGADIGLYTDVEVKDAEYNLLVAKNDLIESTLDLLLVDLYLKKYSSNLSVENIQTINRMLVW